MRIQIRYQHREHHLPELINLTPDEYFDPLDEGEILTVRSVPKFLDANDYTLFGPDELKWTVLEITDGDQFWRIRTQFLDGMRSFMHHSQASDGREEIIHSFEFAPGCFQTIRTLKEHGKQWTVVVNQLDVETPVKIETELDFRGAWSWEESLAFGDVS